MSEERKDEISTSELSFSEKHDGRTGTKRKVNQERPDSPESSCVFTKSDQSMSEPAAVKDGNVSQKKICEVQLKRNVMVLLFLFLLLTVVPPAVTGDDALTDMSDVSDLITRANAGTSMRLTYGDIRPNEQRSADSCTFTGCKWPKHGRHVYVPVSFSSRYTREEGNIIIRGLLTFHQSTCIRFIWRRWWHQNYIYFFSGSGCWSSLGRQRGGQAISLRFSDCLNIRTVQHEVLHALGFHHEQVRTDRDGFVSILNQNILPGKESNFVKVPTNNMATPYDFDSVMHYSNFAFSRNGWPTIVSRKNPSLSFGQATQMSYYDIMRVNRLYRCWSSVMQERDQPPDT